MVVRDVQRLNDAVAYEDGIAQRLHGHGMLFDPGRAIEIRHRADGQHELVVGQIERLRQVPLQDAHPFAGEVDRLNIDDQHAGATQHFPERLDDVGNCHVASSYFVEHRRKQDKILFRRQHDLDIGNACQPLLKMRRCVSAGKTTAEDQNSPFGISVWRNRIGNGRH